MRKAFILDTSVLLHDPRSIYSFGDNLVVLPAVVIEEIDKKKNNQDLIGRNAREVARELDKLREKGTLSQGIQIENGGYIKVELNHRSLAKVRAFFNEINNDNRILAVALNLQLEKTEKDGEVVLVSKDAIMRIKADALEISSQDYLHDKIHLNEEIYHGYEELWVEGELIDTFYKRGYVMVEELQKALNGYALSYNEFILLKDRQGTGKSAIGKLKKEHHRVVGLSFGEGSYWGIKGRNLEQRMALEALLDDDVSMVTLTGKAGTGKTLLSLTAGLYKTNDEKRYQKLLITKPVIPVGRDIGFLPGDKDQKLRPWVQPIYDNLELILGTKALSSIGDTIVAMNRIEIEALTYIRGRSVPNQFIVIDEAQNLTKHEIKTIITRVGEGSKIVLMGDTEQIDHPYLDEQCNGLTYVINRFRDQSVSAHIHFKKVERSTLAQLGAEIL
ncbi:PhoH family protein [Alkaliphilus metalliredigens QYMF]|uniref:PhoH family protein n=1 Tax=Alkaliphilus metalliredigens (strain QYMF) TaxID=293826 RepID=A6TXC4_ALKMQ|nr:PhoH family protein [Alkaliphilus metalliredigens]ABR50842.1 PhoH family protein [Alkaliphilus metalliredigens QYMF]